MSYAFFENKYQNIWQHRQKVVYCSIINEIRDMYKTYYDVNILSASGDTIIIKGITNGSLNSLTRNIDTIQNIEIIKQYDKKIK